MNMNAREIANLFFDNWYCENGLPLSIVSDRDKLFTSKFWKALHRLTGIKLNMSTAYHPQTDVASERTNKTVDQALRYFVDRHQTGWVAALPRVRFNIMATKNASTGYTPFHLHLGRTP
jgi:transposase InsO family protein